VPILSRSINSGSITAVLMFDRSFLKPSLRDVPSSIRCAASMDRIPFDISAGRAFITDSPHDQREREAK
jgi:hypothetical protein